MEKRRRWGREQEACESWVTRGFSHPSYVGFILDVLSSRSLSYHYNVFLLRLLYLLLAVIELL